MLLTYHFLNPVCPLCDIKQLQFTPLSHFAPVLCSMLCLTPSGFYLSELGHDSLVPQKFFGRPGLRLAGGFNRF